MSVSTPVNSIDPDKPYLESRHTGLLLAGIMGVTICQFLDATIVNVALEHMQTDLAGAGPETISWSLTSFIIAGVIGIPLTGWLADRIGTRALMLWSVAGFLLTSALCGMATSLTQIVVFRALQGLTTAFMGPLSQSAMFDVVAPSKQAKTMGIYGMAVMLAPISGPILGGYLTDTVGWQWCFLINLPIGIPCLALLWWLMPSRPITKRPLDLTGFALIAIALASFQLVLDRGNGKDWFDSREIVLEAIIAISALWMFFIHSWGRKNPLFSRELLSDSNFRVAMAFMTVLGIANIALGAILPTMYQTIYGYGVVQTGLLMAPRGIGVVLMMPVTAFLISRVDNRWLLFVGYSIAAGSMWMMTHWSIDMDRTPIIITGFIQGLGLGLVFVPMNMIAFSRLAPVFRTEGTSLMSLFRNLGASVGISVIVTQLVRNTQVSHADIAANVTSASMPTIDPASTAAKLGQAGEGAMLALNGEVTRQAAMIAYLDNFYLLVWVLLFIAILPFLLKPVRAGGNKPALDH